MSKNSGEPPIALTIAGSDSGGGAGIQADIKMMTALGTHATSAITALTAQNTIGVQGIHPVPAEFVRSQLESILNDMDVRAAKIGMIPTAEIAGAILDLVVDRGIPLVADPVMIATSGDMLVSESTITALRKDLFPRSVLVTPNRDEAAFLLGRPITEDNLEESALELSESLQTSVLLKGGDSEEPDVRDILAGNGTTSEFGGERFFPGEPVHGTGCTLSAGITARLAKGDNLDHAIRYARMKLAEAILFSFRPGEGARVLRLG